MYPMLPTKIINIDWLRWSYNSVGYLTFLAKSLLISFPNRLICPVNDMHLPCKIVKEVQNLCRRPKKARILTVKNVKEYPHSSPWKSLCFSSLIELIGYTFQVYIYTCL